MTKNAKNKFKKYIVIIFSVIILTPYLYYRYHTREVYVLYDKELFDCAIEPKVDSMLYPFCYNKESYSIDYREDTEFEEVEKIANIENYDFIDVENLVKYFPRKVYLIIKDNDQYYLIPALFNKVYS